jgi:hypothetical protein
MVEIFSRDKYSHVIYHDCYQNMTVNILIEYNYVLANNNVYFCKDELNLIIAKCEYFSTGRLRLTGFGRTWLGWSCSTSPQAQLQDSTDTHTPHLPTPQPLHIAHNAQEVQSILPLMQLDAVEMLTRCNCSGISRSVRAARPALSRAAFQPIKKNFAPAICSRFASTANAVKDGRVHQVIGAVVDGTPKILFRQQHYPRLAAKKKTSS